MSSKRISLNQSMLYSCNIRRQFIPEKERSLNVKPRTGRLTRASLNEEAKLPDIIEKSAKVLVGTYARPPIVIVRGKGCKLYDLEGREYLDMSSGTAENALGHSDPDLVKAAADQANTLIHVSNVYRSVPQGNEAGALLVFDEVQCGLGRTGYLWAHEAYGVFPDIMTIAKSLAGGIPIGAVLVKERVASAINYRYHGSTFAGSPLACQVALATFDKIVKPDFLMSVSEKGESFRRKLAEKLGRNPHVKEVRGRGLIIAVELDVPASPFVDACRESGLLILTSGRGNVVRLAPPLVVTEQELDQATEILASCLPSLDGNSNSS